VRERGDENENISSTGFASRGFLGTRIDWKSFIFSSFLRLVSSADSIDSRAPTEVFGSEESRTLDADLGVEGVVEVNGLVTVDFELKLWLCVVGLAALDESAELVELADCGVIGV
jgi:hypothetical protein